MKIQTKSVGFAGHFVLRSDKESGAVLFTELRLFNLAGRISGNLGEDDLAGSLVAGKLAAVVVDLFFCAGKAFLDLHDRRRNLAETLIGQADDSDVLDRLECVQEVLDLNRIEILAAGDNDVFLAVDEVVESVLVLYGHIAGVEPAVIVQDLFVGTGILVVLDHDAGTLDGQLSDLAELNVPAVFIDNAAFPSVSRDADGPNLIDIFNAQMDTAGSEGFGQAVVCVVFVVREIFQPVLDHGGRNRLCADMHKTPLIQLVILKLDLTAVNRIQDILRPWDEEPYDCAVLPGYTVFRMTSGVVPRSSTALPPETREPNQCILAPVW